MPDQSQRLTISVQGAAEVERLAKAYRDAQKALSDLQAAQRQVNAGTATPQLLAAALGSGGVGAAAGQRGGTVPISQMMAAAEKDATSKVAAAKKAHADAQKQVNQQATQQNKALDQYITLMSRSTSAADRDWAATQRRNQELAKTTALYRQLGSAVPAPSSAAGRLSMLGAGLLSTGNRVTGYAVTAASSLAYGVGASSGIPGAGPAAANATSTFAGAIESLPGPAKLAIALGAAALAAVIAKSTAESIERSMDVRLAGSSALPGGMSQRDLTQGVLAAGSNFVVPFEENTTNARTLGQIGVGGQALPRALQLGYAAATMSGMPMAQGVQMVGELMVKQGMNVDQAAKALQNYRNAATAAHVPLQRMFDIMQQMQANNLPLGANAGQLASLQAQLGMGVNPAQLLAPAMGATGFQAKALEGILGVSEARFHQLQLQPTKLFDLQASRARALSGGDTDVLAGLLQTVGMDTSGMNPQQVSTLATMIQSGKPGAAQAYYAQYVRAGANIRTTPAAALISHEAAVQGSTVTPITRTTTLAPYGALGIINPPGAKNTRPSVHGHAVGSPNPALYGAVITPADVKALAATLPAGARPFAGDYLAASQATGVPVDVLVAQDLAESGFNPRASNKGHLGLGQLSSDIISAYGVKNPFDPAQNIMATAQYDAQNYALTGHSWSNAFAAYNEGAQGFVTKGFGGVEHYNDGTTYMDRIASALNALVSSGFHVDVTVHDSQGRVMPSTSTLRHAPSTAAHTPPGARRVS